MIRYLVFLLFTLCAANSVNAVARTAIPGPAKMAGFTKLTFSSNFSKGSIAVVKPFESGKKWYIWSFFGQHANPAVLHFNRDRTLTLMGGPTGPNAQIATAAPVNNTKGYVGEAFGGGAYIEASLAFQPDNEIRRHFKGHPSFWAMALEHLVHAKLHVNTLINLPKKFKHFVEVDIFEYDLFQYLHVTNVYGGTAHDWYGIWKKSCTRGFCSFDDSNIKRWIPAGTKLTNFHQYAILWRPAIAAGQGYLQYYFDGTPVGNRIHWKKCGKNANPKSTSYNPFCVLDSQHLVLILGTGQGEPMIIHDVRVYQSSSARDAIN